MRTQYKFVPKAVETDPPEFGWPQELANIIIHAAGILFGLMAIPVLVARATMIDNTAGVAGICIYGLSFLMLFVSSTLYHLSTHRQIKRRLKKFDRISIYFMIAGTYTPLIWHYMLDHTGIALLCILWGLVLTGILFEVFFPDRFNIFSVISYIIMGLIFIFVPRHFFGSLPPAVINLVIAGVVCYGIGVLFYLWQKWLYHHAIWHVLVLAGVFVILWPCSRRYHRPFLGHSRAALPVTEGENTQIRK